MMFWYGNAGWAFWQIALMWAFMIAFWGLLIWAVYALITSGRSKPGADGWLHLSPEGVTAVLSCCTTLPGGRSR